MTLINKLCYPNILVERFAPQELFELAVGKRRLPLGQYAYAWDYAGEVRMVRDPLGLNKLFWAESDNGQIVASSRIDSLLERRVPLDQIRSVPPGHAVSIRPGSTPDTQGADLATTETGDPFDLLSFQTAVRTELEKYLDYICDRFKGSTFVVCLSGGLDSTLVTCMASKRIPNVVTTCFSYLTDEGFRQWLSGCAMQDLPDISDDFKSAVEIAKKLNVPLIPVFRSKSSVAAHIRTATRLCQDWRDFNVHCAVVNLFLAQDLRSAFPNRPVVVLTGDLMNELICDYHEEFVEGAMYYRQPRIPLPQKRRFFIRGLDAGAREIGVFNAFGLTLIQPFACVADQYLKVPSETLGQADAKMHLNGNLVSADVLQIGGRVKQRAQVGGVDGGTLGVFHRLGLRQDDLYRIWVDGVPDALRGSDPSDLIQFGRYRTTARNG